MRTRGPLRAFGGGGLLCNPTGDELSSWMCCWEHPLEGSLLQPTLADLTSCDNKLTPLKKSMTENLKRRFLFLTSLWWNGFPHDNMWWITNTDDNKRKARGIILDNIIIAMCDIAPRACARGSGSGTAGAVGCILIISHSCSRSCRGQTEQFKTKN